MALATPAATPSIEAEPEEVGLSSARLGNLTRSFQRYVDERNIPGGITAVARHGKLVHFQTYGNMDDESGKPMAPETIFRIYSMTKPIVSVGLMTLYEEGRFNLDDPASRYIPEFKDLKVFASGTADSYQTREPAREMTVRDLLMHTSGLGGPLPGPGPSSTPVNELYARRDVRMMRTDQTLADTIARLGELPLAFDPGSRWLYSIATDVVGYLCEVLSGQSLDRFLSERIFKPLGMSDTAFWVPTDQVDRLAACYQPQGQSYVLQDAAANSTFARPCTYFSGVGGLVSTAADYLRFAKMLANGGELHGARILGPRTLQLMTLNHLPGGSELPPMVIGRIGSWLHGYGFGLGFGVLLDPTRSQTLGTPGEYFWDGAASTQFFVSPADGLLAIFMTQLMAGNFQYRFDRKLRVCVYQSVVD